MKKKTFFSNFFLFFGLTVLAQEHREEDLEEKIILKNIFENAQINGHVRNFFLNTINQGELKDYYSNAVGGSIGVIIGNYKGFEIGVKSIFSHKAFGNDLYEDDISTGKNAKWEYELYDVLNKNNYQNIDRLDELFLRYKFGNSYLSVGKLKPEYSPLLNQSDGRMMPFSHRGFWGHLKFHQRHTLNIGLLDGVAPRATTEWFDFDEGLGLFNNGYQPNGERADYHKFYPSNGIGIVSYQYNHENIKILLSNFYIDKLNNTTLTEVGYNLKNFNLGLQAIYQTPLQFSEELPYENRYVQPEEHGQVISSRLGWGNSIIKLAFAYTHAFDTGRFLFPKELGRDRLFTSISRSRLEGLGGVDVYAFKSEFILPKPKLHLSVDLQKISGLELGQTKLNKYNIDETFQTNTRLTYALRGFLDGLTFDLLWVYRKNLNINEATSIFNRSNYNQLSFITNFSF